MAFFEVGGTGPEDVEENKQVDGENYTDGGSICFHDRGALCVREGVGDGLGVWSNIFLKSTSEHRIQHLVLRYFYFIVSDLLSKKSIKSATLPP